MTDERPHENDAAHQRQREEYAHAVAASDAARAELAAMGDPALDNQKTARTRLRLEARLHVDVAEPGQCLAYRVSLWERRHTLPTTNDLDALIRLRPRLLDVGTGSGRHAFASDAPRYLAVSWLCLTPHPGWGWRTRERDLRESGRLGSLDELDRLIAWVDERPYLHEAKR
jgi:hypothetical protein